MSALLSVLYGADMATVSTELARGYADNMFVEKNGLTRGVLVLDI